MVSLDISKAYDMSWRYAILKNWKIDGRMLCFIENFMKERTLRVVTGNMLSNEAAIEKGLVQGAVLSVTLLLLAISEICDGIQEPVKIIGNADKWMILTSHKHVRSSENQIQKAMHQTSKWVENTGFQISIKKTKSILFSRKNYLTVNRPTINIGMKRERIEQVRQHRILGLIFDLKIT
jgi:hypothetical protein